MSNVADFITLALILLGTYLLASLSAAIIVCKLFGLPDPRTTGSKNPGATNVLRIGSKLPAFLTLLGDILKGFLPVLLTQLTLQQPTLTAGVVLCAFLGHCFPVYYRFQGGKGVATALGGLFGFHWMIGAATGGLWLLMAFLFRYSSLSSMVSLTLSPIITYFLISPSAAIPIAVMTAITLFRHRTNMQRLWRGEEGKIGQK